MAGLQFATFNSLIEMPFYTALFASKLDHDKLDDSARSVLGLYEPRGEKDPGLSSQMQILGGALTSNQTPAGMIRAEGIIKNFNTVEDFKQADKAAMLHTAARQKYRFTYWFAFPALHSDPQWKRVGDIEHLGREETTLLVDKVGTWRYATDNRQHGFFLAKRVRIDSAGGDKEEARNAYLHADEIALGFQWVVGSLRDFESGFFNGVDEEDQLISFVDPSTYPENPSWPLRNLLVLVRQRYHLRKARILCYRDTQGRRDDPRSVILPVAMDEASSRETTDLPKVTGWERNVNGKLQARMVNLADYMDPTRLADQAVDLNLKLMKWRISPNLDLDSIKDVSCLLLGAGTLGSYVSRNLMGWGVRRITFVDYGSVSFSNPVRQPLFEFKDCLHGGAPKATRAAESLKQIYPGVESAGYVLSVPMLGHPVLDEEKTRADFEKLEELIDKHDVIFLLMDTRESRWLPTIIAKAKGKIVMNAALGFDTYVVMRHGPAPAKGFEDTLGCYFCNDVVAPADSVKDQTLDQQCTVTRPGVAAIASALLVELLTSVLQHPLRHYAPAPKPLSRPGNSVATYERDPESHPLGLVPHQIRGFLANFQNMLIQGPAYPHCSACSAQILNAYRQEGWDFVKKALGDREYVTELSGLAEIQRQAEAVAEQLDFSDDGDDDGDDGEAVML
ncbi:autophagy ubiquitin-activating enzyme [Grosmannia clavigera kw1407]|uniref:Ubiquitin-like modifier-activating enzyme ATG7 n=1 Tax=Grosmannia clavigera (strain kw1407 / UAMH 11150) TaxID=655863 RepID=F0XCR3_GROCL|nr:autophagy ubiquitin-activating enzyme [Grosmannia clavigera kw1407]EFX03568.1 autophagy ubiquitin-activating enzyme [Grosmannia clavigera kw1407]